MMAGQAGDSSKQQAPVQWEIRVRDQDGDPQRDVARSHSDPHANTHTQVHTGGCKYMHSLHTPVTPAVNILIQLQCTLLLLGSLSWQGSARASAAWRTAVEQRAEDHSSQCHFLRVHIAFTPRRQKTTSTTWGPSVMFCSQDSHGTVWRP